MDNNTSNDHLLKALTILMTPRGATITELSEQLGVSVRTGFRIKKSIVKRYPTLEKYRDNGQVYFKLMGSDVLFPTVDIKPTHVANIDAVIRKTTNREHKESLERIKTFALTLVKKSRSFHTDYTELYETEINSFQPYIKLEYDYSIVETIRHAILTCKTVDISYIKRSTSEEKKYTKYTPLGIIWGVRNYLLTRPMNSEKEPFLLALTNITDIKQNKKSFEFPEDYNVKDYAQNMFGSYNEDVKDYELIFNPHHTMGNINEYHLHNSQIMTPLNDEETQVEFQASGLNEVFNFIIQWEDKVKIISPQELKDKVSQMTLPIID